MPRNFHEEVVARRKIYMKYKKKLMENNYEQQEELTKEKFFEDFLKGDDDNPVANFTACG